MGTAPLCAATCDVNKGQRQVTTDKWGEYPATDNGSGKKGWPCDTAWYEKVKYLCCAVGKKNPYKNVKRIRLTPYSKYS